MSSLRPHQNININISYNLGSDKPAKTVSGKKIVKSQKATCLPAASQCDVAIKLKSQKSENITKKCQQIKPNTDIQKKHHKKKVNIINRNSLTADLIQQRRIRTEGPSTDMDASSTLKKQSKSKAHFKSTQPASSGKLSQSRLKIGLNKTSKQLKKGRAFSELGCQWKKLPIDIGQYTISQSFSTIAKKIKTNTNCSFFGNDKVVSKLLNISLLASELSNSQPITSERRSNAQSHSACLKQYMSTIDMRLISRMQDDVPIFAKKEAGHQDLVRAIMSAKSISLEELTRQVIKIQRFWKGEIKNRVVNKYKSLFREISNRLNRSQKSQISAIVAESEYSEGKPSSNIEQGLSRRHQRRSEQYLQEDEDSDSQLEWVKQNKTGEKRGRAENKLKINRQSEVEKELCEISDDHLEEKDNLLAKVNKDHFIRWNSINKKIGNTLNDRGATDSVSIMDALMKQSDINQKWIDDGEVNLCHAQINLNQQDRIDPETSATKYQKRKNQNPIALQNNSLGESLNYNPIQFESKGRRGNACQFQPANKQEDRWSYREQQRMTDIDNQIWIVKQMTNDHIAQNYLECEFERFDLNLEANDGSHQNDFAVCAEILKDESRLCSDQSVEIELQSPNGIVCKSMKARQRKFQTRAKEKKIDNETVDKIVNEAVAFLVSQFSIDVSYILKKSAVSKAERPIQPAPRVVQLPCIQTNFESIKDYINRFIVFLQKNDAYVTRITHNINKNNGPSSNQILSYLRPEEDLGATKESWADEEQNQEEVFIIPGQFFQQFGDECQAEYRQQGGKELAPRVKAFLSFWHRCLYESYNECLDHERPYGIMGKPYEWNTESKIFRKVTKQRLQYHLHHGRDRLLGIAQLVGGIIFEKIDSPFSMIDFNEQQREMMNEQRLSRILATELLQSEQSWVIYHDQTAELMVELARMIKETLWFQTATEIKKLQIRRRNIERPEGSLVGFSIEEL